jgi:hypothetical protein
MTTGLSSNRLAISQPHTRLLPFMTAHYARLTASV